MDQETLTHPSRGLSKHGGGVNRGTDTPASGFVDETMEFPDYRSDLVQSVSSPTRSSCSTDLSRWLLTLYFCLGGSG